MYIYIYITALDIGRLKNFIAVTFIGRKLRHYDQQAKTCHLSSKARKVQLGQLRKSQI